MRYINMILVCGLLLVASGANAQSSYYEQEQLRIQKEQLELQRQQLQLQQQQIERQRQEQMQNYWRQFAPIQQSDPQHYCQQYPTMCAQGASPGGLYGNQ